jgi:hypothetical protein
MLSFCKLKWRPLKLIYTQSSPPPLPHPTLYLPPTDNDRPVFLFLPLSPSFTPFYYFYSIFFSFFVSFLLLFALSSSFFASSSISTFSPPHHFLLNLFLRLIFLSFLLFLFPRRFNLSLPPPLLSASLILVSSNYSSSSPSFLSFDTFYYLLVFPPHFLHTSLLCHSAQSHLLLLLTFVLFFPSRFPLTLFPLSYILLFPLLLPVVPFL